MSRWLLTTACLWLAFNVAASDPLRSAGDADFPPYEFIDADGQPAGFNIELLQAIARQQDRSLETRLRTWADARAALVAGDVDIVAMYSADFRDDEFLFSSPFLIINHEIFVRQGGPEMASLDDAAGQTLLVQRDSWLHEQIQQHRIEAQLRLVDSERQALRALAQGQADAALVSTQVGRRIMQQENLDRLVTTGGPLLPAHYAFAVRNDQPELLDAINQGLATLRASGEFNRLYQQWFGEPPPPPAAGNRRPAWPWLVLASLALLVLAAWIRDHHRLSSVAQARPGKDGHTADRSALLAELTRHLGAPSAQLALVLIDLDQFRLVNEQTDPTDGDAILDQIQDRLGDALQAGEQLFRFGGDKFAVLIEQSTGSQAVRRAETLREAIDQHGYGSGDHSIHLTASLGISVPDTTELTAGQVIKQAEAACFAAKEAGRNRSVLFDSNDPRVTQASERMFWVSEAERALRENRLLLHFQTIEPALADPEAPLRAEILLRLRRTDGQIVTAGLFMPACEQHHLAQRIDLHVIEQTLSWLVKHRDRLPEGMRFYINLSARSLDDDRLLPAILALFERYPVDPGLVGFEVTETAVMNHLKTGLDTIETLARKGCVFALDDFGTGTSSMAYLKQLPVQEVKIDGSFIRAVRRDASERLVLREINALIQTLGKASVIEQVETDELRQLATRLGIDYVQGWAISHPRPLGEFPLKPADQAH